MLACGADEVSTYSMIDPRAFDRLRLPASSDLRLAAPLARPLVEEQSIMRTTLIPGLLDALKTNASHRVVDARLFEIGRVFHPKSLPMQDLPEEEEHLGAAAMGHAFPPHWGEKPSEAGFFFIKGLIEAVLDRLGLEARFEPVDERRTAGGMTRLEQAAHAMHPYRRAVILVDDRVAGVVGEAHPLVARDYDLPGRVALAEINLSLLLPLSRRERAFSPLPRFPAVERDVAVLAPVDVPAAEILATIRDAGGDLLKDVSLFDLYAGGQVPEGKRSLAFSLVYRSEDRTLTDEEVDRRHSDVRRALESKGLALR
jgi:phenylalanyl-tRNA synthetase beta chain